MFTETRKPASASILHRTRGTSHGPITRLVSPSDLGAIMKPFVFLDRVVFEGHERMPPMERGWHPHSGIATVTVVLEGSVRFAETTGKRGVLPKGSVEWMRAGGGVWHTGEVEPGPMKGFQLWVALPPELENGPCASTYVMRESVPEDGPVRLILGSYQGMTSPIDAPPMTYLVVTLKEGERWRYEPPRTHDVAWVAISDGQVGVPSPLAAGELAIFDLAADGIDFVALDDTRFVLGSAPKHPHDLVLGSYSVHSSMDALRRGEAEIQRIGRTLRPA